MLWFSKEALSEALLMGTHNIYFYTEIRKIAKFSAKELSQLKLWY